MVSQAPSTFKNVTSTSSFGSGKRESHDSSALYERFPPPVISADDRVKRVKGCDVPRPLLGDSRSMDELPDSCVALVVASPPYFVGKGRFDRAITPERRR